MGKLNGANGKRILIIVYPNTSRTLRLVLVDDVLAGNLCDWLHRSRIPYERTTTILPGVKKTAEESSRVLKLLMDFRRHGGAPLDPGAIQ